MNTDIRIELGFFEHPKTRQLLAAHGPEGVLSLIRLWVFTAANKPTGILAGMTPQDIASAAGWKCSEQCPEQCSGQCYEHTLTELRFLSPMKPHGRPTKRVRNWEKHQPWAVNAPQRQEKARKAAAARWKRQTDGDATSNAKGCSEQCSEQCPHPILSSPSLRRGEETENESNAARARPYGPLAQTRNEELKPFALKSDVVKRAVRRIEAKEHRATGTAEIKPVPPPEIERQQLEQSPEDHAAAIEALRQLKALAQPRITQAAITTPEPTNGERPDDPAGVRERIRRLLDA